MSRELITDLRDKIVEYGYDLTILPSYGQRSDGSVLLYVANKELKELKFSNIEKSNALSRVFVPHAIIRLSSIGWSVTSYFIPEQNPSNNWFKTIDEVLNYLESNKGALLD